MKVVQLIAFSGLLLLIGCAPVIVSEPGPPGPPPGGPFATIDIPPGHLPPPGECRIWFPDRPPGHQPPPGPCPSLVSKVPPGAWLLFRPAENPKHLEVSVYHHDRPGIVTVIRVYEAATGRLLREEVP